MVYMTNKRLNRLKRFIGTQNDLNGEKYQMIVRDYLEDLTGEFGVCNYEQGVDVIVGDLYIEVKGAESFTTKANNIYGHTWKSFRQYIPYIYDELTHFCFYIKDKRFNSVQLIYFVPIEKILDLVHRHHALKRKSKTLNIPFLYVLMNYDPKLSKID